MTLSVWGCGAADGARLFDVDADRGPYSPGACCCGRKPTRAWISYKYVGIPERSAGEWADDGRRAEELM